MVGGMSWESSLEYYRLANTLVEQRLGGLHSAKVALHSVEFAEVTALQEQERWDDVAEILATAARGVQASGADLLLMCTTTFHQVADQVAAAVDIPFLHLADVVADAVKQRRVSTVGVLGTAFTMERSFFRDRLASHDLTVILPDRAHHAEINRIIYDELVHGRVEGSSRKKLVSIIDELWDAGAHGVVLGCTELELLVRQPDCEIPVFPATTLHVRAAVERALAG
jgi:aspartate racemase